MPATSDTTISTLSEVPPEAAPLGTVSCRQVPSPLSETTLERITVAPLSSRSRSVTVRPAGARTQADAVESAPAVVEATVFVESSRVASPVLVRPSSAEHEPP